MVITDRHIKLTFKALEHELLDYWTAIFERPSGFIFEAGDWIDLDFDKKQLHGGKTYSISSSPTEVDIKITFRAGMSEFKRTLKELRATDDLYISQYGNDFDFQLNKNRPSVLIAGGVGIAPFRSMIKELADNHALNDVTIIYLNQTENFLFRDELDEWSELLPNLSVHYLITKDINRIKRERYIRGLVDDVNQNFYISGPPAMVEANEHLLIDMGVPIRNIRIDSFTGY